MKLVSSIFLILAASLAFSKPVTKPFKEPNRLDTLVNACNNCHGNRALMDLDTYPILTGQRPGYLRRQLENFKTGARTHPYMNAVASKLSRKDIDMLVKYFSGTDEVTKLPIVN